MASRSAAVLSGGGPAVQNGGEPAGPVTRDSQRALPPARDALPINGRQPEVGGTCDELRQPIRAKMAAHTSAAVLTKDSTGSRLETNQIPVHPDRPVPEGGTGGTAEQSEPLDLSLPKRRDNRETRCGRFLDACESSLIMEVDEYDGEGDRDVVEEDSEDLPSFLTASTNDLLLIDDRGIPYTLSPDGLRVPQVDAPVTPAAPQVSSQENLSQSLDHAPPAHPVPSPVLDSPPSEALPPGPGQAVQVLTSPSSGAPFLLSSAPLSLSLPPGASAPMFLLLSSSESTSTPIAVLDPTTGQLSQITAPVTFPQGSLQPHPVVGGAPHLAPSLSYADSRGSEAISPEPDSNQSDKPLTSLTPDPSDVQSPAPGPQPDPERLPLDDHLYFSSSAAPPSPPKLEPLDPLDPLSPAESPGDPAGRRVLYCQLCPRVFFYLSDLERHRITHSQKKPHVCQQCGKAFKRSSHLQRHKHIHTGQRNFVCPICAKRFREAGELQRHQRVHTGEKPYQCQLCHTRFAERNTLRRHTKRKHPYHQAATEMLGARSGAGDQEEPAEWYSSAVSHPDDSESEAEA